MDTCDDGALFAAEKLVAPADIIGEFRTPGGYTKTTPREWTAAEILWLTEHKSNGYSVAELAEALDRTTISVQIKLKRLTKSDDSYNQKNRDVKYQANQKFAAIVKPKSVLDVYAGNSWWKQHGIKSITNDTDPKFEADYALDAMDLLCRMKLDGRKFDLIDLDPYGSAYDQFDLGIKLAKKAIVVSFGEWGHKRWKRFDFVRPRYGISKVADFGNGEKFIAEFQRIAACNKKHAEPVITLQYSNFVRVYFQLTEIKITEQWSNK